jgi:hypothetical protein
MNTQHTLNELYSLNETGFDPICRYAAKAGLFHNDVSLGIHQSKITISLKTILKP